MQDASRKFWPAALRGALLAMLGWVFVCIPPFVWLIVEANQPGDVTPITYAASAFFLLAFLGLPIAAAAGIAIAAALCVIVRWDRGLGLPLAIMTGACVAAVLGFLVFEGAARILSGLPFAWYDSQAPRDSLAVLAVYEAVWGVLGGAVGWCVARYLRGVGRQVEITGEGSR